MALRQQLRPVFHQPSHTDGRRIAEEILDSFPSRPIPGIARRVARGFKGLDNYRLRTLLIGGLRI